MPNTQKEFSCGGGPFSFFMAGLVSISCNRNQSMLNIFIIFTFMSHFKVKMGVYNTLCLQFCF